MSMRALRLGRPHAESGDVYDRLRARGPPRMMAIEVDR